MKGNFENVKEQVCIEDVAHRLLGAPVRSMFYYPGEKTPSIKIYAQTQSFFDFGRSVGGDCIRLWSHVRQVDNWTALKEIKSLYGLGNEPDRENIKERIQQQEKARESAKRAEMERKKKWTESVDRLKTREAMYTRLLASEHIPPLSDVWMWCENGKQLTEYRLDYLCGLCE